MLNYMRQTRFKTGEVINIDNPLCKNSGIFFGYNTADKLVWYIKKLAPFDILFFCTDKKLSGIHGSKLFESIKSEYPESKLYLLPDGESGKTFTSLEKLCEDLISLGATKNSVLISFGGGSAGNLTGLAASLIFRGIRFVEIPTTTSHQTDGTLSNKQAINGRTGKNHFGIYHSPEFIWIDTKYLETEPANLKKAGIVEGIKNGLVDQPPFLEYLEKAIKPDCNYNPEELTDLCYKIIASKIEILKKDPTEKNYGVVLEYGHTFAHAIEWLSEGRLLHGEAVSIGIKMAAELSMKLGYINRSFLNLHYQLIDKNLGLAPEMPDHADAESIIQSMIADNKKTDNKLRFVLIEGKGKCVKGNGSYLTKVNKETVCEVVSSFLESYKDDNSLSRTIPIHIHGKEIYG